MVETDFQLATRRANFWGEQLDIAELLGEQRYIEHAARMYFDAAQWLTRLAVADIKAQGQSLQPSEADCAGTHHAWQNTLEKNDGFCACSGHPIKDVIYFAAQHSRTVRDKINAQAAETICHQAADIYGDAFDRLAERSRLAKTTLREQKARRIPARNELLQRNADRRAGLKPRRRIVRNPYPRIHTRRS